MSNSHLPREILDYVVGLLHDKPDALKQCCLASKSWVPRTRKYLFASITFNHADDLEAWKKTFPDPANSPAYHTRSLFVGCPRFVTAADAEEGGWISSLALYSSNCIPTTTTTRRSLSSPSTTSHRPSNPSK